MARIGAEPAIEPLSLEINIVPPDVVGDVWPNIEPWVRRAIRHGLGDGTDTDHLKAAIERDEFILWLIHDGSEIYACVVLSVDDQHIRRKLFIHVLAGHSSELWADLLENSVIRYRDQVGASCIEASCRKGLARKLLKRNWKQKAIIMELSDG